MQNGFNKNGLFHVNFKETNLPDGVAPDAEAEAKRYDDAIKNYRLALKYDPANGNRYFDLGFALATNDKLADALRQALDMQAIYAILEEGI